MQDHELEYEKNTWQNSLEHKTRVSWSLELFFLVLFLVKPSFDTTLTIVDNLSD